MNGVRLLSLSFIAALIAGAVAAQPPPPPPPLPPPPAPPPPMPPGYVPRDLTDMRALMDDMAIYLDRTKGRGYWPGESVMTPGMSWEEADFRSYEQRRDADMLDISGVITGPGSLSRRFARTTTNPSSQIVDTVGGDDVWLGLRAVAEDRLIDLAVGVRHKGESHIGTIEDVRSGAQFTLELGDGYAFRGTITQREPNDDERRRNVDMAERIYQQSLARNVQTNEGPGLGDAIVLSPFTNSVIREGDPRAAAAE